MKTLGQSLNECLEGLEPKERCEILARLNKLVSSSSRVGATERMIKDAFFDLPDTLRDIGLKCLGTFLMSASAKE